MTPEERKAVAEIFRRIRPNSRLSPAEAQPAIKYLLHLKNFSKVENDVLRFFAHHFTWFCEKEAVFADAPDEEVLRQVRNLFRAYMGYRRRTEAEEAENLSFSDLPEDRIQCTKPEIFNESLYSAARAKAEARRELKSFLGFFQSLRSEWRKNGPANRFMQKILLRPKIKVIKETLKRKSTSEK